MLCNLDKGKEKELDILPTGEEEREIGIQPMAG